jgi:indolepyruvate ferredoxin oxidoreductase alpha subunit
MKKLLSGNEAIARGAYEAGCEVATAYPGTPSTEILEAMTQYPEIKCEWSINEKVALEVASGASYAGARSLAAMKHVGLNVAADPLFTLSYTGIQGGLVVVTADDPNLYSSQNEQDNRHYARSAKLPMLEPADSDEARRFTALGFKLSEQFDCPVLLRTTTRISHGESLVEIEERKTGTVPKKAVKAPAKYVMLPGYARPRHPLVEERMKKLMEFAENFPENRIEKGDRQLGIISSGVAYQYAREAFPQASFLKLAMVWPLPEKLIRQFAQTVDRLYVVEELDPFLEDNLRAMGLNLTGKQVFPLVGELSPELVRKGISGPESVPPIEFDKTIPDRPPNLCAGCPHRGVFYVLKKLRAFVCGDIGCYTLAAQAPLKSLHTCLCMGAGVGQSFGMEKVLGKSEKVVAVIGDSTFFHSGITPLIDIVYNQGQSTIIVLDNLTTAMTGRQGHPGSGLNIYGQSSPRISLEKLGEAIGIRTVTIDPYDLEQVETVLKQEMEDDKPSLVIARAPCVLIPEFKKLKKPPMQVSEQKCTGCKICIQLACPAISWVDKPDPAKKRKGYALIDKLSCTGCEICAKLCGEAAILREELK